MRQVIFFGRLPSSLFHKIYEDLEKLNWSCFLFFVQKKMLKLISRIIFTSPPCLDYAEMDADIITWFNFHPLRRMGDNNQFSPIFSSPVTDVSALKQLKLA